MNSHLITSNALGSVTAGPKVSEAASSPAPGRLPTLEATPFAGRGGEATPVGGYTLEHIAKAMQILGDPTHPQHAIVRDAVNTALELDEPYQIAGVETDPSPASTPGEIAGAKSRHPTSHTPAPFVPVETAPVIAVEPYVPTHSTGTTNDDCDPHGIPRPLYLVR